MVKIDKKCRKCGKIIKSVPRSTLYCLKCKVKVKRVNQRAAHKRWYTKNAEKYKAKSRQYRQDNLEHLREYDRKRRRKEKPESYQCKLCSADLVDGRRTYCDECLPKIRHESDIRQRKRRYQKQSVLLEQLRALVGCERCGCRDRRLIQFHHIKPNKKLHNICASLSPSTLKKELQKCLIVCANCHIKEHHIMMESA
jgi:hypothetical protein